MNASFIAPFQLNYLFFTPLKVMIYQLKIKCQLPCTLTRHFLTGCRTAELISGSGKMPISFATGSSF
jgi:hypothetical protein